MKIKPVMVQGDYKPTRLEGHIEFRDVSFCYPSRPGELVLNGVNLQIQPHKVTAVVGDSGAGKSTLTHLIMRLYDPTNGTILLDGVDIKK